MSTPKEQQPDGLSSLAGRLGTSVCIGVVMLAAIIWGRALGLGLALAVVSGFSASEFYAITRRERRLPNEILGIIAAAAMPIAAALWGRTGLMGTVSLLTAATLVWHLGFRQMRTTDAAVTVFGAIYTGFLLAHLVFVRQLESGTELTLALVVSVWANDVFAYLVGSTVGRHKMAPIVSPNKSWEGFAAGTIFTIATWIAVHFIADVPASLGQLVIIGLGVAIAAVVGDLAESRLKREAGVKDSGASLPGHGGFLDRFDSLILASVVGYYLLVLEGVL